VAMTRRIDLLVVGVVVLALAGSLAIHALIVRQTLQVRLQECNRDAAGALAQAMSQQRGDPAVLRALAAAHFELGRDRLLRLQAGDGRLLVELRQASPASRAPAWFTALLPIGSPTGSEVVGDGAHELGRLQLELHASGADDALWDASTRMAGLLAALALVAGGAVAWLLRRWQRPLRDAVAQAQALEQGRLVEAAEPRLPEWRALTHHMNATVRRLREVFAAQAEQVALLQRQAQQDPVTGLPLRRHFVTRLQDQLDAAAGPGAALVLVRVMQLETLNERLGRDDTDRVLRTVGDVLQTYVERVPGALAGRLNGSDFGLCLPVHGLAAETAESIHGALAGAPALRVGGCEVAVGAADGLAGIAAGAALAEADAALAHAEAVHGLAVEGRAGLAADPAGARAWRDQIAAALADGRARLGEFPVLAPEGGLIHLECPLRLQLEAGGEFRPAAHWLALARRSRLMPEVDLAALELALQATAADGRPRAVHISTASIGAPGFPGEVARRLRARPDAARRLALEWAEPVRPVDVRAWAEAAALWHAEGVRLGVEHAGAVPQRLPRLQDVGIDYVKVDARHLRGLGADASVHAYAQGLLALIHGLGLVALAEGVDDASDLVALWALGFDGATGAAVGLPA